MRLEATGRSSEVVERYETEDCAGCGGLLAAPHIIVGWRQCSCAGGQGHRTRLCRDCGHVTFDPPHDERVAYRVGGADYFNG